MFSIVIPLYNKAKSIATTIQSVLGQSFADFELIIVDDGSTDDSVRVVNQFTDKRIRLIQKENGGVCSARNVGILHAQYDYIALLDADDYWDTDYLFEQQKLITDFPQAAMWGINFAPVVNREIHITYRTGLPSGFRGIVQNYFTIQGRISDLFCSSSVVVKKAIFDKNHTNYKIVINPVYDQKKFQEADMAILRSIFGERLYDFSGINEYTNDYRNYNDLSHFKSYIAADIIKTIYK